MEGGHFAVRVLHRTTHRSRTFSGDKTDPGMAATALLLKLLRRKDLKKGLGKSSELRRGLADRSVRHLELCRNPELDLSMVILSSRIRSSKHQPQQLASL